MTQAVSKTPTPRRARPSLRGVVRTNDHAALSRDDPACDALPHAVTFFLSTSERRRVLRKLRELHPRREVALLMALDARHDEP